MTINHVHAMPSAIKTAMSRPAAQHGALVALAAAIMIWANGAQAGGLSIGGRSLADVDASVGGLDAKASVGGRSLAEGCVGSCGGNSGSGGTSASAGGVSASVGAGSGSTGSTGGLGVSASIGGGSGSGGGLGVTASVRGGGLTASVGTTGGATGGGTGSGPGTVPGPVGGGAIGGVTATTRKNTSNPVGVMAASGRCAGVGNTQAFNGFALIDRQGETLGTIRNATIDSRMKIREVRIQTPGNACYTLSGGAYDVATGWIKVNMDRARLQ